MPGRRPRQTTWWPTGLRIAGRHGQIRKWRGTFLTNQHGFSPLIPRGSSDIYSFATEPRFADIEDRENARIGFRISSDDGHTRSPVRLIRPENDPEYLGMFVMRMCETGRGTWLLAPHTGMSRDPRRTRLYAMRSENRGKTWKLLPAARPGGWTEPSVLRMEEGRASSLGGARVLLMVRTAEGHLWELRSDDDGLTWSEPKATPLIHPLAPPMLFHLSDGKTLAAFHHNRASGGETHHPNAKDRSELWVSTSQDDGRTWSEPRFVLVNSAQAGGRGGFADYTVSYIDVIADRGELHLFIAHQFRQLLHVRFSEDGLKNLPTRRDLVL